MAESDWTVLADAIDASSIRRGSTQGITPPSGGDFVYAFNSAAAVEGASGLYYNGANFAPAAEGASIRGVIQKGAGGGTTGSTPILFTGLGGNSVNDTGYLLCLTNDDPARIQLVKGSLTNGPAGTQIMQSDATYAIGTWLHLRLDAVVNGNGDVALSVFMNDLSTNPIGGAFSWSAIPGMDAFIDDATGINSGSVPLVGGRIGYGVWVNDVTRRAYVANVEIQRQVP